MKKFALVLGVVALSGCSQGLSILGFGQNNEPYTIVECPEGSQAENSKMLGRSTFPMRCEPQIPSPSQPPLVDESSRGIFDVFLDPNSAETARATARGEGDATDNGGTVSGGLSVAPEVVVIQ